ncbi:MAG: hypothetical protein ACLVG5_02685 [Clostridium sp.]
MKQSAKIQEERFAGSMKSFGRRNQKEKQAGSACGAEARREQLAYETGNDGQKNRTGKLREAVFPAVGGRKYEREAIRLDEALKEQEAALQRDRKIDSLMDRDVLLVKTEEARIKAVRSGLWLLEGKRGNVFKDSGAVPSGKCGKIPSQTGV